MDYFDDNKLCSVNEFYDNVKKLKRELGNKATLTDKEVEDKKALLLSAQFVSKKYIELAQESPKEYPEILPEDIIGEMDYIDAVYDYMKQHGDGGDVLNSYPVVSLAIMVKDTHLEIRNAGIDNCVTERVVHAVVPAIEAVTLKAVYNAPQFNVSTSGIINAQKVLSRYPEIVKLMTDEAVRTVFTNKAERNQWSSFTIYKGNASDNASLLLSQSVTADPNNKVLIESNFSIYDWAVMETVATLYAYAEENNKLDNGSVAIDIQSIDKILKRDVSLRMSQETKKNILTSDIVRSLVKLMGNHVVMIDPAGNHAGDLIDGELAFVSNKLCLIVKSKPVLFEYTESNGRNHLESIKIDELKLDLKKINASYSTETVAIYRFLLGRLREIFGSYKMDSKHMTPKPNYTNSVSLESIINAVYPEGLGKFKDAASKKRYILNNTEKICKAMENKGIFFKKCELGRNMRGDDIFIFHRN